MFRVPRFLSSKSLAGVLVAGLFGCSTGIPTAVRDTLEQAKALWTAQNIKDYTYTVKLTCGCSTIAAPVEITVVNGQVTGRIDLETGLSVPTSLAAYYPNAEGLFALVQDAITRKASTISVEYDGGTGIPHLLFIDYDYGQITDNLSVLVTGFVAN